jgi:hypothetical protein
MRPTSWFAHGVVASFPDQSESSWRGGGALASRTLGRGDVKGSAFKRVSDRLVFL